MNARWDITIRRGVDWTPVIRWRQEPDTYVRPVVHEGEWRSDGVYRSGAVVTLDGTDYLATGLSKAGVSPADGGPWLALAPVNDAGFTYSLRVLPWVGADDSLLELEGTGDGSGDWSPSWDSADSEAATWKQGVYEILATSPGGVETVLATGTIQLLDHGASVGQESDGVVAVPETRAVLAVSSRQGPQGIQGPAGEDGALSEQPGMTLGPGVGRNLASNTDVNSIAPDVSGSTITGGGSEGFPQQIGSVAGTGASVATIGGGYDNRVDALAGTVAGGAHHVLEKTGTHGTIGGGSYGTVSGDYGTIAGGTSNTVSGDQGVVAGGGSNTASGTQSSVGGGYGNTASGVGSTVAGGTTCEAGGQAACVGGGLRNTAPGYTATATGGQDNTASGQYAAVAGGRENASQADYSAVVGGRGNTASGIYACASGREVVASGAHSTARGYRSVASINGQHATACGNFAVPGDAQFFEVPLRKETTDGAPGYSMTVDGGALLVLSDHSTWAFEATVVARCSATGEHAAYKLDGVIKRDGGAATTAIVGAVTKTVIAESNAAWDVTATAVTSTGDLRFRAYGEDGKSIRWFARVRVASVGMP